MACMGPIFSKEKADEIYEKVVKMLTEDYDMFAHPTPKEFPLFETHRQLSLEKLKKAINDCVYQQDCEDF
jgi:hypothetical protein